MFELGTQAWLDAFRDAVNSSERYRETAQGWRWPVGLAFLGAADGASTRHVHLDLYEGVCRRAEVVDEDVFATATFRILGPYDRWSQILDGRLEPMKALVLKRLRLEGDLLTVLRYMPAAKALLECTCRIDTDVPAG